MGAAGISVRELVFNHDGSGIPADLAGTPVRERDAADLPVAPLAGAGISCLDWCLMSTAVHNGRTRRRRRAKVKA